MTHIFFALILMIPTGNLQNRVCSVALNGRASTIAQGNTRVVIHIFCAADPDKRQTMAFTIAVGSGFWIPSPEWASCYRAQGKTLGKVNATLIPRIFRDP